MPKLRSEGGFALVEVMVSAVLLVVVATATYPVIDQAAERSGSNRARGVAVSLAEQDQDRMRELPTDVLEVVNGTATKASNGIVFTIGSKAEWTSDATGVVACSASTGAAEYLRITTTVTWPKMNGIDPVVLESFVSPKLASINRGTVVLTVQKADGQPQPGIAASIQGSTKVTDATGCALWTNLSPGTSDLTINSTGYVDITGAQSVVMPTTVAVGQTSSKSLLYDQAAGVTTDFELYGDLTQMPRWYSARFQSGINPIQTRPTTPLTVLDDNLTTAQVGGLFPFTAGYQVYAGNCLKNDPTQYLSTFYSAAGAATGKVTPARGSTNTSVDAFMRRIAMTVTKNTVGAAGTGGLLTSYPWITVIPNAAAMPGCTENIRRVRVTAPGSGDFQATATNFTSATVGGVPRNTVRFNIDLPWGAYVICVDNGFVKRTINDYKNTPTGGTPTPTAAAQTVNLHTTTAVTGQTYFAPTNTCTPV